MRRAPRRGHQCTPIMIFAIAICSTFAFLPDGAFAKPMDMESVLAAVQPFLA